MKTHIPLLYDRIKDTFTSAYSLGGTVTIEESKLNEALGPMYTVVKGDDSLEMFIKWLVIPMVVVFGEDILTENGKLLLDGEAKRKIELFKESYSIDKGFYLQKIASDTLPDELDFINFAGRDISAVGLAYQHAFKYRTAI